MSDGLEVSLSARLKLAAPTSASRCRALVASDAHDGDYHDALANKRSTVVLFLVELSGALSPPAKRHLRWLAARAKRRDRTPYESWAAASFMSYWLQRISAAIVGGDARRAFTAISKRAGLLT